MTNLNTLTSSAFAAVSAFVFSAICLSAALAPDVAATASVLA